MRLLERVRERRQALADRWGDLVLSTYPPETASFLRTERDPFRNPVGTTIRREIGALAEGLLTGADAAALEGPLDAIVKIRAVQALSPAQAIGFVLLFKQALGEVVGESAGTGSGDAAARELADLDELHGRVDALTLAACDRYVACRERIFDIRARAATARTYALLKRAGLLSEVEAEGAAAAPGAEGRP